MQAEAEALFLRFLLLSLTGGGAVLLLRMARPLLRRGSARWTALLWALLALRMVIPWGFALPRPAEQAAPLFLPAEWTAQIMSNPPTVSHVETAVAEHAVIPFMAIAGLVWLAGTVVFITLHIASYHKGKRRLLKSAMPPANAIQQVLRSICLEMRMEHLPALYIAPAAQSPLTLGLLRSVILLPAKAYTDEELEFILRHELCHFRHGDLHLKILLLMVNALHWFNPAMWLLRKEADAAMELACDERIVRQGGETWRLAYSRVLVSVAGRQFGAPTPSTNFDGGKNNMKEMKFRLRNILYSKKKRGTAIALAMLLCAALAITAAGIGPGLARTESSSGEIQSTPAKSNQEPQPTATNGLVEGGNTSEAQTAPTQLLWPTPGVNTISASYGDLNGNFHDGIDITNEKANGKTVVSAADGYVEGTGSGGPNGMYIVINHGNGLWTAYEHLQAGSVTLQFGEKVDAGQPIAKIGSSGNSTGPHLHFEVLLNNETQDPMQFFG